MAESVFLVFGEELDPARFVELVVSLGGVTGPGERGDARLSDGHAHVWVHLTGLPEDDPDELAVYEARLGGRVVAEAELEISRTKGSEGLAWRIVDAAARRWRFVVFNGHDEPEVGVRTVDELRARVASGASSVFWPPDPGDAGG
ncbi:hypothetical protein [Actinomadura violacea]|uniref:Uncharacterized protein n=1 Tax=Actinomadura violacea TaxID=2819934 RepID=A0ABS3RS20_9ACTN|nr:hypothetical protein [Actinomadura violacea]MBO2458860.1 hypothetical protein [Actinomadura violacea]